MKKKVAILSMGDLKDQKGMFNAVIARTKHLQKIACDFEIDAYMMVTYDPWYVRLLRKTPIEYTDKSVLINGVKLNLLWRPFSLVDYVLRTKLHKSSYFENKYLKSLVRSFREYDLIDAHSTGAGLVAYMAKMKYGIPYVITWHGSDIHMGPFTDSWVELRKKLIENSAMNLFVSKKLLSQSVWITNTTNKTVLYNGCDENFCKYSEEKRTRLRIENGVCNKKVVAFSGLFRKVKNTTVLPEVFRIVHRSFDDVVFWFIGDGEYRKQVESACTGLNCRFFGNMQPSAMPDLMNCVDVLILPSFNEGLPLVVVEAIKSGCFVVGSRAGGIPEVIGTENSFELNENFVEKISNRIIEYFNSDKEIKQTISNEFDWNNTAYKELEILKSILLDRQLQ